MKEDNNDCLFFQFHPDHRVSQPLKMKNPFNTAVVVTTAVFAATFSLSHAAVTAGYGFYVDASLDTDGDDRWEDLTVGNPTGQEFLLDLTSANPVTRVTGTSSYPGISAAYNFVGGQIGNVAGATMVDVGTSAPPESFQTPADGDWTNNGQDVSLELWFKPDSLTHAPANGQILFEDGGGTGIGLFLNDDVIDFRRATGTGIVSSSSITGIAGEFIQVVGVWDYTTSGVMSLYVNGALAGTASGITGNDWSGGDGAALGNRGEANTGGIGGGQSATESFRRADCDLPRLPRPGSQRKRGGRQLQRGHPRTISRAALRPRRTHAPVPPPLASLARPPHPRRMVLGSRHQTAARACPCLDGTVAE